MTTKSRSTKSKKGPRSIAKDLRSAASALEHGRHATARKKLAAIAPSFSPRQADTILAALRAYQEPGRIDTLVAAEEIASEHGEPLSTEEIDDLCEQINLGPKTEEIHEGDIECDCSDRSWYGAEHDSACPFAGQPNPNSKVEKAPISKSVRKRLEVQTASTIINREDWETAILDEALNSAEIILKPLFGIGSARYIADAFETHVKIHLATELMNMIEHGNRLDDPEGGCGLTVFEELVGLACLVSAGNTEYDGLERRAKQIIDKMKKLGIE